MQLICWFIYTYFFIPWILHLCNRKKHNFIIVIIKHNFDSFFLKIFPFNFIWNKRIQKIYSPNPSPHLSSFVFYFNKSTWRRRINFQSFCLNLENHKSFFFKTFFFCWKYFHLSTKKRTKTYLVRLFFLFQKKYFLT